MLYVSSIEFIISLTLFQLCETSKFISENVCTFPSSVKSVSLSSLLLNWSLIFIQGITEGFLPFIRQGAEPAINLVKDSLAYKVAQVVSYGVRKDRR